MSVETLLGGIREFVKTLQGFLHGGVQRLRALRLFRAGWGEIDPPDPEKTGMQLARSIAAFRHQARITSIGGFPDRLLSLASRAARRLGIRLFWHAIELSAPHFFSL